MQRKAQLERVTTNIDTHDEEVVRQVVFRMNGAAWGIAFGLLCGLGLFVATNILVVRGGPTVGPHLGLLAVYFPGYRVTFLGSFIGFVYAFVIGYGVGRTIGSLYNRLVKTWH